MIVTWTIHWLLEGNTEVGAVLIFNDFTFYDPKYVEFLCLLKVHSGKHIFSSVKCL